MGLATLTHHTPRPRPGYRDLTARAERISDPACRQSFLDNIPENRAIIERRERRQAGSG
jgi:hypothetical protein